MRLRALVLLGALTACFDEPALDDETATLSAGAKRGVSDRIKAIAAQYGSANPLVFAGVPNHETGLVQCWADAPYHCQGPYSAYCGGPVLAGSGDGACHLQRGGLGIYQFDAGTHAQTLAAYGHGILDLDGNVWSGVQTIITKVRHCPNTPWFPNDAAVVAWLGAATPGTGEYETFLTAMAWCYNGCSPTGCSNHWAVREKYRSGAQQLIDLFGWDYWYGNGDCGSGFSTVYGIRAKWESLGGCAWGAPVTNESDAAYGGRFNHFDNGASIYWTEWTAAHEVHGAIRERWAALGWEWSWLGYPISDEYTYDGTPWGMQGIVAESEFEGGWLSYVFATGELVEWPR
ncbi:MAG TPA: hypothetical protein VIV11_40955 [Kofleriaceae bacterium]